MKAPARPRSWRCGRSRPAPRRRWSWSAWATAGFVPWPRNWGIWGGLGVGKRGWGEVVADHPDPGSFSNRKRGCLPTCVQTKGWPDRIVCAGRVKCWETRPALQRRFQLPILAVGPQRPEGLEQTGHLRGGEGFSFSTRVGCVRLSEHAGRIFPWLARGLYSTGLSPGPQKTLNYQLHLGARFPLLKFA